MHQLFENDSERHEALLDPKRLDEARNDMYFRVKDNLHVVIGKQQKKNILNLTYINLCKIRIYCNHACDLFFILSHETRSI